MTDQRRRAFFFYQQGPSGKWQPVIMWDEVPKHKDFFLIVDASIGPAITEPVELNDEDFILTEPEDFGALKKKYPNPKEQPK